LYSQNADRAGRKTHGQHVASTEPILLGRIVDNEIPTLISTERTMDVEKTIEFILTQQTRFTEQQAQLATHLSLMLEQLSQMAERQAQYGDNVNQLSTVVLDLARAQERANQLMIVMAEHQVTSEKIMSSLAERMSFLIDLVERLVSDHGMSIN
jgi:glucose-6-phosphate isomerase